MCKGPSDSNAPLRLGFAAQLTEILYALPPSRQTLLFSATLPSSLIEFAQAGLQEPNLVRLDAESKISPDLQSAFFTMKSAEKEGALLHVLTVSHLVSYVENHYSDLRIGIEHHQDPHRPDRSGN